MSARCLNHGQQASQKYFQVPGDQYSRGTRNQEAKVNSIVFPDDSHFVATGYFEVSSELKKKPFDVLVLEYEKPDVKGQTKLVFADEFHINKKEDDH